MEKRNVDRVVRGQQTMEGAGVRLRRALGGRMAYLDPFLLLDEFGSDNPADYLAGFPWHPHRGIETVTYMLSGEVRHGDSLGNAGVIGPGDVQWMTAGSGIIHEEMPRHVEEALRGFQLWVNLPAKDKMAKPRYQGFNAYELPEVTRDDGTRVRVVTGEYEGTVGPVTGISVAPQYLHVHLPTDGTFQQPVEREHTAFAYVVDGPVAFGDGQVVESGHLVVFGDGDLVEASAQEREASFLLVSGAPLGEPVVRFGPFVMNTQEEIEMALREYRDGTFVRS